MIILEPTHSLNAGCDNQPFWSEIDRGAYPDVYRAKIEVQINGTSYQQNGQTALLIADAQEVDPYTWQFRWDISPVLKEYFAQQQRDAGDLPLCFQSSLVGWNGITDLYDSYCKALSKVAYYEIDGQNHEVTSGASDQSSEFSFINASTRFDEVTDLDEFNPHQLPSAAGDRYKRSGIFVVHRIPRLPKRIDPLPWIYGRCDAAMDADQVYNRTKLFDTADTDGPSPAEANAGKRRF
jgi:hypothetical protein